MRVGSLEGRIRLQTHAIVSGVVHQFRLVFFFLPSIQDNDTDERNPDSRRIRAGSRIRSSPILERLPVQVWRNSENTR
jgi:hypothetical protein